MILRTKYYYIFFILNLFVQNSFAQLTEEIQVSGNTVYSSEEIIRWSGLRKGLIYNDALIDSAFNQTALNLARFGYYHPEFKITNTSFNIDSSAVNVSLFVNEGEPTIINNIFIGCVDSLPGQKISEELDFLKGQVLIKTDLENQINSILNEFENSGFPFIRVVIRSIDIY